MMKTKETLVTGFALFSMFFGAGNLILPPFLGFNAGPEWFLVALGFFISAVALPLLGILAHARLQGTMLDFANKVSPVFSIIYCLFVYAISISLPAPRTASVTHEMAIQPFFGSSSLLTSSIYFILVLVFVLNRSKILDILGKFLTPLIIGILLAIIGIGLFSVHPEMRPSGFETPVISGILEGYQTFDAIGAVVVGGVIIISLNLKGHDSFKAKKQLISRAGVLAGLGLFLIYLGLILSGAMSNAEFDEDITRTALLSGLSLNTLGNIGNVFLSVLVSLACFTTAVGIITGTADFMKGLLGESQQAYLATAIIGCILGVVMGQFDVHYIIDVALPALMFIYPITIVLIFLNVLPERFASKAVFRAVVIVTLIFSIPDFLSTVGLADKMQAVKDMIPFANYSIGWLLPVILTFAIANLLSRKSK
ncbi:branched-chain amino acid transport system II carrier protein [Leptobacterium flavescens]|uniref:Branched-chain amino acid transport system II carrier protein n=1 Tax=Leptobacterium flavescens TaxID=472055 RepID=A0A6P0UMU6_9FLAO|nr:branched-chain amino acid transport system II carrier protein [Leptobacterium flavescens]NER13169.1 branched-chain amino acid transport system II carrier protein [Leptobacterium flavescens]